MENITVENTEHDKGDPRHIILYGLYSEFESLIKYYYGKLHCVYFGYRPYLGDFECYIVLQNLGHDR